MQQSFECGLCGVPMTVIASSASPIRYYRCPHCGGWCASPYRSDAMRNGAIRTPGNSARSRDWDSSFETIKERLEEWLKAVDADYCPVSSPPVAPAAPAHGRWRESTAGLVRPKASR